jgi:hypothetical protein
MKFYRQVEVVLLIVLAASTALPAQDPAVLLEKGIYAEETLGNLPNAMEIYKQVLAATGATRGTSATALFRLGMCYQKTGRSTDAQAAFSKLAKSYPEQKALISKIPGAAQKGSVPRRLPWVDGEELQLVDKGNQRTYTYTMESAQINGKAAWSFRLLAERVTDPLQGYTDSKVLMDAATLLPISSSSIQYPLYHLVNTRHRNINYSPGVLEIFDPHSLKAFDPPSLSQKRLLAFDQEAYDSNGEQLDVILRTLPLHEGFQTTLSAVSGDLLTRDMNENKPLVSVFKISVPVREMITVPAGVFECFKVVKSWSSGFADVYWISADNHAYIVKIGTGEGTAELTAIRKIDRNQPVFFEDRESGLKISAPAPWHIGRYTNARKISNLCIIDPETRLEGYLTYSDNTSSSLDESVNEYIKRENESRLLPGYDPKLLKDPGFYVVRPGSRTETSISGLPAINYIAGEPKMSKADYVFLFIKANRLYQLDFNVLSKSINDLKPSIDAMISSLVVK